MTAPDPEEDPWIRDLEEMAAEITRLARRAGAGGYREVADQLSYARARVANAIERRRRALTPGDESR